MNALRPWTQQILFAVVYINLHLKCLLPCLNNFRDKQGVQKLMVGTSPHIPSYNFRDVVFYIICHDVLYEFLCIAHVWWATIKIYLLTYLTGYNVIICGRQPVAFPSSTRFGQFHKLEKFKLGAMSSATRLGKFSARY